MSKSIVIIGPSPESKGGIASVIASYRDAGLFNKWPIVFLPTHVEAGKWGKLSCALLALSRFVRLLLQRQVGLLHVHVARRNSFWRKAVFMQLAFMAGCPVLIHLHSGGFPAFYADECGTLKQRLVRYFLKHAAGLIVLTPSWQAAYTPFSPKAIHVLPNFVPFSATPPDNSDKPSLIFLGRLTQEKGVFDLFQAVAKLTEQHPELMVRLGGEGDRSEVDPILQDLNITQHIQLEGWVDGDKKAQLLKSGGIFVLPSYVEGLPMGILEAMSAGLPVVATRVGGVPDIIEHDVNGLLVEPGDVADLALQLDRLLSDTTLRNRLALSGQQTVKEQYSVEAVMPMLEKVYSSFNIQSH
jgi:glycosyltransferase involved in cell wall biosynthesis